MTIRTRKVRFAPNKGIVAAPVSAYGAEYDLLVTDGVAAKPYSEEGDYAVVDICGPLSQHASWPLCSYDDIRAKVDAALDSDKSCVVLRINSPGGDFSGSIELSRELKELAGMHDKKLMAFTDSQCLSAAYALACACDEIIITDSAFVGSVGVWAGLCSQVEQDKMMGLDVVIVPSGTRKADRNPHVAISEGAVTAMQGQVDSMAALFFDYVASSRGMKRASVEALQGAEVFGARAVALGLANRIVNSWLDFVTGAAGATEEIAAMAKGSVKDARASYREALAKLAGEDSDDGKEARAALSAMDKEDEKVAKKAEGEKKEGGEGEGKEAKAGDGDNDEDDMKAAALAAVLLKLGEMDAKFSALVAKVDAPKAEAPKPVAEKAALSPAGQPLVTSALQGATQGNFDMALSEADASGMDAVMGLRAPVARFEVGSGDLAAARKYLADRAKEGAK